MIQLQSELKDLLQLAYSAERAASFAYQGHAGAINESEDKIRIKEIEVDEWETSGRSIENYAGIRNSGFWLV
jgi:hypothetical protein